MKQTEKPETKQLKTRSVMLRVLSILFWLVLWQLVSMRRTMGIFLASPVETVRMFFTLCLTGGFWRSMLFTTGRILTGFLLAVCIGCLLAALTERIRWLDILLMPVMRLIRTVPVVSFIILALILVSSRYLTQLISFLMAMPIIYMNVRTGIGQLDAKLTEMARLFGVPLLRRLRFLYVPQLFPAFESGTALAMGFAWKSGIAAEVIGIPVGSVGERLQQAKVFLATPDLFAWTLAVVLASILTEKLWRVLLSAGLRLSCGQGGRAGGNRVQADGTKLQGTQMAGASVRITDVSKSYDGRKVLDQVSAAFAQGEICALMGSSGAGKTTLLRLIAGLEQQDEGEIAVISGNLSADDGNMSPESLAGQERDDAEIYSARVSFMFQEDRLLEYLDAPANVRFVNPFCSREMICRELKKLGLSEEDCTRPVGEFSGGMKRRVAFLRTLLTPSQLLLLDEPFKGLDEDTAGRAIAYLLALRRGRTVLMSTHSSREAELCNARVLMLEELNGEEYRQPEQLRKKE